jgi:hypothetical protein
MARRVYSNDCASPALAPERDASGTDALRPIASVRPEAMLPPGVAPAELPRVFTGVYEFSGLMPDTLYTMAVQADNQNATLETRTLPSAVPTDLDRWCNVLLVSCFQQAENRQGLAGIIVSQLQSVIRPHLTLCMGDQVYLDLPTLQDFPDNIAWLAAKFEKDYTLNWRGPLGYTEILLAAPSNPWPRHANPAEPPAFLASEPLQGRFPCATRHRQKGNHVIVLSFRQHGSGIEVRITYWPITRDATVARLSIIGPMTLVGA